MNIFRNTTLAIGITSLTALTSAALPGISAGSAFTRNDQNCSDEIKQHLYYETADAFEDPYIHEYAVRFDEFGLRNCDYEAKYMGQESDTAIICSLKDSPSLTIRPILTITVI